MKHRNTTGKPKAVCAKCNSPLEQQRLNKQRYCLACHAENMRRVRPKHSELPDEQRKKANARSYLNVYLRRGTIVKMPCEICGNNNSQAHHDDYTKPLEVRWFCRFHHLELHKQVENSA